MIRDTASRDPRNLPMDMQQFLKNRCAFPPEELTKYAGQYVAWSPDGTRILASDDDLQRLDGAVKASGYDPAEVVVSSVPFPDEVIFGGGGLTG
jgi:hypothetical protein